MAGFRIATNGIFTQTSFGVGNANSVGRELNGTMQNLAIYSTALTDAQLVTMTT